MNATTNKLNFDRSFFQSLKCLKKSSIPYLRLLFTASIGHEFRTTACLLKHTRYHGTVAEKTSFSVRCNASITDYFGAEVRHSMAETSKNSIAQFLLEPVEAIIRCLVWLGLVFGLTQTPLSPQTVILLSTAVFPFFFTGVPEKKAGLQKWMQIQISLRTIVCLHEVFDFVNWAGNSFGISVHRGRFWPTTSKNHLKSTFLFENSETNWFELLGFLVILP